MQGGAQSTRPVPTTKAFGYNLNGIEKLVAAMWAKVLDIDQATIQVNDSFYELGGTHEQATTLLDLIEDEFGTRLPATQVADTPTLGPLANVTKVQSRLTFGHSAPPEQIAAGASGRYPVFCVAAMGSTNLGWRRMAALLDPVIPIIGVESTGFEPGGDPIANVEGIAAYHCEALRSMVGDGPVVLCGHSYGGRVAYEIARQLRARGQTVAGLVLLDSEGFVGRDREVWTVQRVPVLVRNFLRRHKKHNKARASLWVRRLGIKRTMEGEGRVRWVISSQRMANRRYKPGPYDGDLTLLTVDSLLRDRDETLGWGEIVRGKLELREMPGEHSSMLGITTVGATAAVLSDYFVVMTVPKD